MNTATMPTVRWARAVVVVWVLHVGFATGAAAPSASKAAEERKAVTFNKDVAPLVFERCASCHRPGEVAPFPLLSYRDVSKHAKLVRAVVEDRTMPPWRAEPGALHFAGERRLTDEQVATVARWVDGGLPEGDPADLPPAPQFVAGWRLGTPDLVLSMAEPYALAAEGPDVYRCFVVPLALPPGKYLEAVEFRPSNRRVVHHALLTMLPHAVAQAKLNEGDGKSFSSGLFPPGQPLPGQLALWGPGMEPRPLPKGFALDWPGQVDLVIQLHLHPGGRPETEQSTIGLHLTDEKPRNHLNFLMMNMKELDIKPGDGAYAIEGSVTLPRGTDLHGLIPHMHLLGRTASVHATLPDGTSQPLITIKDWSFQWQAYYEYAAPIHLPAGTRIHARWTFDNSLANPANPSRPPKRVTYGGQTTDEMAVVILELAPSAPKTAD